MKPFRNLRAIILALPAIILIGAMLWLGHGGGSPQPIRVGVLYSLSGTMAVSEAPLADAVRLGVEEINAGGGLLGRPLEVIVADGRSDWRVFAREAEELLAKDRVDVLFACWTSACRKAVRPVVERLHGLMVYAVQYEGLEASPNILYTGLAPNQQIVPGTRWAMNHLGRRVYLVGSDYVFPRTANRIIRDLIQARGGEILGERYLPLGAQDMTAVVADISALRPDVVLSTINGDSNAALFTALREAGLTRQPLLSFSAAEPEMQAWDGGLLDEHYAAWSYFQTLPGPENQRFVNAFKARYGEDRTTSDPVEAAYLGVLLWAQAVRDAGSSDAARVNPALLRQSLPGPSAAVSVDPANRHLWKMFRIGKVQADGQFRQVFASRRPLRPQPWPVYRSREEWRRIIGEAASESPAP